MKSIVHFAWALPLVLLAACEPADNEPAPGGVSASEAEALDDAAEMVEKRRPPPEILVPEPEDQPADPAIAAPSPSPEGE